MGVRLTRSSFAVIPTLFVVAGPNGCGKSTLTRMSGFSGFDIIDPDTIMRGLGAGSPGQAAREALRRRNDALGAGRAHLVETTLAGSGILRHMVAARQEGYRIVLHFVSVDSPELALDRVRNRVALGGHDVSEADALRNAGCERIFLEKASGKRSDRPRLTAALDFARSGDTLVVWKLSRLARSLQQVIQTCRLLLEKGVGLKVLTRNIDTDTPEGRLFFHMTAAFDEFQRELIVENTRAGLQAAKLRGRRGGRPRVLDEKKIRNAEAMLRDTENYPFVGDVIDQLGIGRTSFYRYFPPERIRQYRGEHA